MQKENTSISNQMEGEGRFLLCDTTGNFETTISGTQCVSSPIQCIDRAVSEQPSSIVIRFTKMPIRDRKTLVELCAVLKRNSHTKEIPVVALLDSKHRKLTEDLVPAGVDYILYSGETILSLTLLHQIINELSSDDRIERHLAVLCPFLNYSKIDFRLEMTVCGAYLDRMVLGGRRLHEICETEGHRRCEYYLNPRLKP